jgi:hypothetical protein
MAQTFVDDVVLRRADVLRLAVAEKCPGATIAVGVMELCVSFGFTLGVVLVRFTLDGLLARVVVAVVGAVLNPPVRRV